jgi:DNA-binding MarR family transcriptional regulator/predicted GNAT family acetyltransferase
MPNDSSPFERRVSAIRGFSRFYTRVIGLLNEGLSGSRFSLTEARVLYELANGGPVTAAALSRALGLDPGYLSRILQEFERDGLLLRAMSETDRRASTLSLTQAGHAAFAPLNDASRAEVAALLKPLPDPAQADVVDAMGRVQRLFGDAARDWTLRGPRSGDIGWVVARHGALYAEEYGFDARFEALVANVAGAFLADHDPTRERCWIAARGEINLGSVFLVRESDDLCRLRLLIVEPSARGMGVGKRLVAACIDFARAAGYRRMTLWTNDVLLAARGIYQAAGFRLVASKPHALFGPPMVGEDWERDL